MSALLINSYHEEAYRKVEDCQRNIFTQQGSLGGQDPATQKDVKQCENELKKAILMTGAKRTDCDFHPKLLTVTIPLDSVQYFIPIYFSTLSLIWGLAFK